MERARNIGKSMMSYLKRAREHKEFLLKETKEFERGKRHLANMMGLDANEMTQADVDEAIDYLFPSGLFDKKARPMMKHPDLLFKSQKDAQFDVEGRPYHYLFYTTLPNYYESLSRLSRSLRELNKHEDEQIAEGIVDPPDDAKYVLSGRVWLNHDQLREKLIEPIAESDHQYLTRCLEHLIDHPYSGRAKEFIEDFSHELPEKSMNLKLPQLLRDETTGQLYTELNERHKEFRVRVKTILNGTGKVDIDGHDILYFEHPYFRSGIFFPLSLTGRQDRVDIIANVTRFPAPNSKGDGAIAICLRNAVSKTIAAASDEETRERLRLAGLLTPDFRVSERKKFGQMKARRKYTWKKR